MRGNKIVKKRLYKGPGREVQTLIFPKDKFTKIKALKWAKGAGFKHYTAREEKGTIRVRQFPKTQIKKVLGTFLIGKDIKGLYVVKK